MNLIWHPYFLPAAATGAAGLAFLALLTLFLSLRRQIQALKTQQAANTGTADQLAVLANDLNALRTRIEEAEQRRGPMTEWSSEPASVNLNRRGQVLRLYRRGESPSEIASCLGLSHGEVKLIIKIHEMARKEPSPENLPARL